MKITIQYLYLEYLNGFHCIFSKYLVPDSFFSSIINLFSIDICYRFMIKVKYSLQITINKYN